MDHTEALQIDFDPRVITYSQLLDIFWKAHSPEHPAYSQQYKAAIYAHNDQQKKLAMETKARIAAHKTVHTEVLPLLTFYRAEDYHQKYQLRRYQHLMHDFNRFYPRSKDFTDSTAAARINGFLMGYGSQETLHSLLPGFSLSQPAQKELTSSLTRAQRR